MIYLYMKISKDEFLRKYNISKEDFEKSGCVYGDLQGIQEDYLKKYQRYDDAGANLVRILLRFNAVHSVKYRIKDPEHLIEKIIRKKIKTPTLDINLSNYQEKVQDLIGIRILHLFKSDWLSIHQALVENFKQVEKPEANIRRGDAYTIFKDNGCKIKNHPAGYRSVHYLVKTEPTLKPYIAEIQVRTILEEAWSEIDHKVRYPYFTDHEIINQYLKIFNRLAGSADEMGDFVMMLKEDALTNQANKAEIEKLKSQIEKSSLDKQEKADFTRSLGKISIPEFKGSFEDMAKNSFLRKYLEQQGETLQRMRAETTLSESYRKLAAPKFKLKNKEDKNESSSKE